MGLKAKILRNQNILLESLLASIIVISIHNYWQLTVLLSIAFALLIIDTKFNILKTERLLFQDKDSNYILSSTDNSCAIISNGGGYSGIAAVVLDDKSNKKLDKESLESIISKCPYPFRFITAVERIDLKGFFDKLSTKKRMLEIQISRLDRLSNKAMVKESRLKSELNYIAEEIKNFTEGGIPVRVKYYVIVSEYGENSYEAQNYAKMAIRQVSSLFDSVLGTYSRQLKASEILNFLK